MDPHKRSATIEVLDHAERVLSQGRFATDATGYRDMLAIGRRFSDRVWAVEGCNGIGKHLAQRLLADGKPVVDVPTKLSARARVFSTGQGRKTDATDAHSIAWRPCAHRTSSQCGRTITRWRYGCWPTAATSSVSPAPPP
jgi:transposase